LNRRHGDSQSALDSCRSSIEKEVCGPLDTTSQSVHSCSARTSDSMSSPPTHTSLSLTSRNGSSFPATTASTATLLCPSTNPYRSASSNRTLHGTRSFNCVSKTWRRICSGSSQVAPSGKPPVVNSDSSQQLVVPPQAQLSDTIVTTTSAICPTPSTMRSTQGMQLPRAFLHHRAS
jgi:hypothetical protein